jgi:hypothetical protein
MHAGLAGAPLAIATASAAAKSDVISPSLPGPVSEVDDDDGDGGREGGKGRCEQDDRDNRIHGLRIREQGHQVRPEMTLL